MKFLINERFSLSNENIGIFCRKLFELYHKCNVEAVDSVNNPLFIEETLLLYQTLNGEDCVVKVSCCKSFTGIRLSLEIAGKPLNPLKKEYDDQDQELISMLLKKFSEPPEWHYRNNLNVIATKVSVKHWLSPTAKLVWSIIFAIIVGVLCRFLCREGAVEFGNTFLQPIFNIIISLLTGSAAVFIFLSIANGICSMGSMATFHKIGKSILLKYISFLAISTVLSCFLIAPFFKISENSQFDFRISSFYNLILSIVPRNLLEPFITNNMLQIIFLSMVFGLILLSLGAKVHSIKDLSTQLESIFSILLNGITKFVPVVAAISVFQIVTSEDIQQVAKLYKLPLIVLLANAVLILIAILQCVLKRMDVKKMVKGNLAVMIQAFLTASSTATLPMAMQVNEEKFGMDKKINQVGIPLGQVLFKPGAVAEFLISALCIAELFKVSISIPWIITAAFLSLILSMAIPPIPNGLSTITAMMFTTLGIPLEGVAFVIAAEVLNDRFTTAACVFIQQLQLNQISADQKEAQAS